MIVTSFMVALVQLVVWCWNPVITLLVMGFLLTVELVCASALLSKVCKQWIVSWTSFRQMRCQLQSMVAVQNSEARSNEDIPFRVYSCLPFHSLYQHIAWRYGGGDADPERSLVSPGIWSCGPVCQLCVVLWGKPEICLLKEAEDQPGLPHQP